MSHQRAGKMHSATLRDEGNSVSLSALIKVVRSIQNELAGSDEHDAEVRFEIFGDYLENEIANGKPFVYTSKMIGI
jgi:hypothetical protein